MIGLILEIRFAGSLVFSSWLVVKLELFKVGSYFIVPARLLCLFLRIFEYQTYKLSCKTNLLQSEHLFASQFGPDFYIIPMHFSTTLIVPTFSTDFLQKNWNLFFGIFLQISYVNKLKRYQIHCKIFLGICQYITTYNFNFNF